MKKFDRSKLGFTTGVQMTSRSLTIAPTKSCRCPIRSSMMSCGGSRRGWGVFHKPETGGPVHVVPMGDTRDHFFDDCWCPWHIEDGIVVHEAADGRPE